MKNHRATGFFPPTGEVFQPKLVTTRLKVNRLPRYFRRRVVRIDQYKYQRTPSKELSWQQRQTSGLRWLEDFSYHIDLFRESHVTSSFTKIWSQLRTYESLRVARDWNPRLCVERKRCSARVSSARARRRKSCFRGVCSAKSGDVHRKSEGMVESQYQHQIPTNCSNALIFSGCWSFAFQSLGFTRWFSADWQIAHNGWHGLFASSNAEPKMTYASDQLSTLWDSRKSCILYREGVAECKRQRTSHIREPHEGMSSFDNLWKWLLKRLIACICDTEILSLRIHLATSSRFDGSIFINMCDRYVSHGTTTSGSLTQF